MHRTVLCPALVVAVMLTGALTVSSSAQTPVPPTPPAKTDSGLNVPAYRFRFLGVYDDDSGEPLPDVEVSDVLSGVSSRTSKTGTLSLFFLPDGGGVVRLRKPGYEMQTFTVAISPADTSPVTIVLKKAVTLATVTVNGAATAYLSPRLRGAVERMKSGQGGYFIDEATMRKHDGSNLANTLLATVSGIMPVIDKGVEERLVSSRTPCLRAIQCRKPDCYIQTFVDGVPSSVPMEFSREQPDTYAMAEFYPGGASVPMEYIGQGTRCGVLLLWTRER
ncbi:MAG TPA: hypothetical protein VGM50_08390 [Gemmatimonadaceae bacterium]|jgi:hypothetical protein